MARPQFLPDADAPEFDLGILELAPIALCLEDFSALRTIFERWRRAGVEDLRAYLAAAPERIGQCARAIRLLKVNRRTLQLFGAPDTEALKEKLASVLALDTTPSYVEELAQLWLGAPEFCINSVNNTLDGRQIDVRLNGVLLPGHEQDWSRVLISVEDISLEETTRREKEESSALAQSLFEETPVALAYGDYSGAKYLLDGLRAAGVTDLMAYFEANPAFFARCLMGKRMTSVNKAMWNLFQVPDLVALNAIASVDIADDVKSHFLRLFDALWRGETRFEAELASATKSGETLNLIYSNSN